MKKIVLQVMLVAASISATCLASGGALAATCPASTTVPYIGVTTDNGDTATCEKYANSGNLNGKTSGGAMSSWDQFLIDHTDYKYLDTTDPTGSAGLADGALTLPTGSGTPSGTWAILAALVTNYTDFAIGIKTGNHNPDWAVFLLNDNWFEGGTWGIFNPAMNLSHAVLYGKVCASPPCLPPEEIVEPTPVPGAFVLMGTVLAGGVGFIRYRRRKTSAPA